MLVCVRHGVVGGGLRNAALYYVIARASDATIVGTNMLIKASHRLSQKPRTAAMPTTG